MALVAAGFRGTVNEVQEASRFALAGAKAVVTDQRDFKPTSSGVRGVNLAPGAALVCGVWVSDSAVTSVSVPPNTASLSRLDVIVMRLTWAGDESSVVFDIKSGVTGSTTLPSLTRIPGGVYEFPMAVVRVRPNVSNIAASDVMDVRVWGGSGGPFMAAQHEHIGVVDLPVNADLQAGVMGYRVTANNGTGRTTLTVESGDALPWTAYDPILWTQDRVVANLGAGGVRRGFYQLNPQTRTCSVRFEIRTGTGFVDFNTGAFGIDLPPGVRPTNEIVDQWGTGLMNTAVGDGFYNFPVQYLIRQWPVNGNYCIPYVMKAGHDVRMMPAQSSDPANGIGFLDQPGTGGIPYLEGRDPRRRVFSEPNVITGSFSYMVDHDQTEYEPGDP